MVRLENQRFMTSLPWNCINCGEKSTGTVADGRKCRCDVRKLSHRPKAVNTNVHVNANFPLSSNTENQRNPNTLWDVFVSPRLNLRGI